MKFTPDPDVESPSAPVIERAPLPILEVSGKSHVVSYVNAEFCRLVGKARTELVGFPFAEIAPVGKKCLPTLDNVYETGQSLTHALADESETDPACWLFAMWPRLDPQARPVSVIIQMTKSASFRLHVTAVNEALLLSGLVQHELREKAEKMNARLESEIAERKQIEAELLDAKARLADHAKILERTVAERTENLRETVGELEAFSYSIAHDLRAPLRSIQGYSSILLEEYGNKIDETGQLFLQRMSRSAIRLDQLIRDVLSYSKVFSTNPQLEPIDLDRLVRDLAALDPAWSAPHADLQIAGRLPRVIAHESLLGQCITNLVGNALKFVARGTHPSVRIWAEARDARVRLWFEDNGVGIAEEDHTRVFRMFERIFPADHYEGTGIGLTIVRKAVSRMGGQCGFDSEVGKGSKFWIELPKAA